MGFSKQGYFRELPIPPPVDLALSELFTMTRLSWVALHGMAHSFIELHKAVMRVASIWLAFCDCSFHSGGCGSCCFCMPSDYEDKRLV